MEEHIQSNSSRKHAVIFSAYLLDTDVINKLFRYFLELFDKYNTHDDICVSINDATDAALVRYQSLFDKPNVRHKIVSSLMKSGGIYFIDDSPTAAPAYSGHFGYSSPTSVVDDVLAAVDALLTNERTNANSNKLSILPPEKVRSMVFFRRMAAFERS